MFICAVCVLQENKEDQYVGLDQKTDVQIITKNKNKKESRKLASAFLCAHNPFSDFNISLVSIFWATISEAKAKLTTTCKTEITSSGAAFRTDLIGCMMSDFISCIARETSAAIEERAEHACSTWNCWKLKPLKVITCPIKSYHAFS